MIYGNMTKTPCPDEDELMEEGICSDCGCPCAEVGIDYSYDDAFGTVTDWGVGSDCCGADVRASEEDV